MRELALRMSVSLDGYVATPDGDESFVFPTFDDELSTWHIEELWDAGLHIMGRVTYEGMAAYWPSSDEPYAPPMNQIPKVVFSRTLAEANWGPVTIASGDLAEEVARLKQQPGKEILAHGGAGFARALSTAGLVDRYRIVVHPVVLGAGLPIFAGLKRLKLQDVRSFPAGAVVLTYVPA